MGVYWACCIFAVIIFGGLAMAEPQVHFDLTSGDCSQNSTVVQQCDLLYGQARQQAFSDDTYTEELDCMLLTETLACLETAMCHCNFSSTHPQLEAGYRYSMTAIHIYNNMKACANYTGGDNIEGEVTGPIDVMEGVNCSKYNRTAGDLALSLAVAQLPYVQGGEEVCSGVEACFYNYDRDMEEALYQKNYTLFCQKSLSLLQCLENASCECGQSTHNTLLNIIATERMLYDNTCSYILPDESVSKVTITCPGSAICSWDNPHFNCLAEFQSAALHAQSDTNNGAYKYCVALYNLANCTEDLACLCGFYNRSGYYRSLAAAKHDYQNVALCENLYLPFPEHKGLNCGDDDRFTEDEKILSIALTETAFVQGLEAKCPGVAHCYEVADYKSSLAHQAKDLTLICNVEAERILCVEDAYCECGHLHDKDVDEILQQHRKIQSDLCYRATGLVSVTRCRGKATCSHGDPPSVCLKEYNYDYSNAYYHRDRCQATRNYYTCVEQVGCACGLLQDGKSKMAEDVYNLTTLAIRIYDDNECVPLTGQINPEEDGIDCPGAPNDDTEKRLVLSFADSSEVAALAEGCKDVRDCFRTNDMDRGEVLVSRDYQQLCRVQSALVHCVEKAYCLCKQNGTAKAENYITTELNIHNIYCSKVLSHDRKPCSVLTASSVVHGLSAGLMTLVIILTSFTMTL